MGFAPFIHITFTLDIKSKLKTYNSFEETYVFYTTFYNIAKQKLFVFL